MDEPLRDLESWSARLRDEAAGLLRQSHATADRALAAELRDRAMIVTLVATRIDGTVTAGRKWRLSPRWKRRARAS
jgi:hypothetical protein